MSKKKTPRRVFGALEARMQPKSGKVTSWRARYTGPDTERHERPFVDKMAAEAWLNDERILIDRGEWIPPKVRDAVARARSLQAITLRDWAERSLLNKSLRTSTRDRYRRMLDKRILPVLGDIPLAALTRMNVTSWYMTLSVTLAKEADERRARGYKGNTDGRGALYSSYQVLASILADAVGHEILDVSPAKVKGGLRYDPLHEPVVLTSEQMWQLTDLLPDYLQAFVPLLATTGLRKGEMRALMGRHLVLDDPERAVVKVRGTVAIPGRNYKIGDPKTRRSTRDIAIPSFLELEPEADGHDLGSGHHALLVRRNDTTGELAWYRCWTPRPAAIGDLVRVAGRRWTVEENVQAAKGHAGLDEHQVRRWDSWHRWTTLAMLAHAFLTILAVVMNDTEPDHDTAGLIAITLGEARRLFAALTATATTTSKRVLAWSRWRQRHQHRAQRAHYQRREGSITAAHRPDLRL